MQTAISVLSNSVYFLCNRNRNFCKISALYLSCICSCAYKLSTGKGIDNGKSSASTNEGMVVHVGVCKGRHVGLDGNRNSSGWTLGPWSSTFLYVNRLNLCERSMSRGCWGEGRRFTPRATPGQGKIKMYRSTSKLSFLASIKLWKLYKSVSPSNKKFWCANVNWTQRCSGVAASRSKFESLFVRLFSFPHAGVSSDGWYFRVSFEVTFVNM